MEEHDPCGEFRHRLAELRADNLRHSAALLLCYCCCAGKTSTIHAVARKINGPNYKNMILELNASDDRGIDVVRQQIKDFASSRKLFSSGLKLVVLDEADAMTRIAQFALRRVIEKYTKSTRFCLLCNYINKVSRRRHDFHKGRIASQLHMPVLVDSPRPLMLPLPFLSVLALRSFLPFSLVARASASGRSRPTRCATDCSSSSSRRSESSQTMP